MTEYTLFIGNRDTGIKVIPDSTHPEMWRVRDRDGRLSDIVNLTRAKEASLSWAFPRGIAGRGRAEWKSRETALKSRTAA